MMSSASAWNKPLTIRDQDKTPPLPDKMPIRDKTPSKTESVENGGVWLFVDNSNIWIEAKKAKRGNLDSCFSEDPRVRIDVGRLADLISRGRRVNHGTLYGSEPPPIDTVWKKIQEKGFEVKKYKRSTYTNREKKVDTQIVVDIMKLVGNSENRKYGSTIILVSGDSDMTPCIESVVNDDWKVEVWGMDNGMSNDLKTLQKTFPEKVEVSLLTKHTDKFTFTNERYRINDKNRNELHARGIVLQGCFSELKLTSTKEWKELEKILNCLSWPWQHAWLVDRNSYLVTGQSLLIILLPDPSHLKTGDELITKYKPMLKQRCEGIYCRSVVSFFDYFHSKRSQEELEICIANMFDELKSDDSICEGGEEEDYFADETENAAVDVVYSREAVPPEMADTSQQLRELEPEDDSLGVFEQVQRRVKKVHQKYSMQCPYHYQCNRGRRCTHNHTKAEKQFFEAREEYVRDKNTHKLLAYKTVMCNNSVLGSHCRYGNQCYFAHNEKEQVCCKCHMRGHPTNECSLGH